MRVHPGRLGRRDPVEYRRLVGKGGIDKHHADDAPGAPVGQDQADVGAQGMAHHHIGTVDAARLERGLEVRRHDVGGLGLGARTA